MYNMKRERKYTVIAVTPETHDRLRAIGKFGETHEELIKRILDERQQEQQVPAN